MKSRARRLSVVGLVVATTACADRIAPPVVPPAAEFLVAAGDSTYWVRSSAEGLRVRSAPLLLTLSGSEFFELRIVEEITDYLDSEFVREILFGYSLMKSDSVVLYADDAVDASMRRWLLANPGEEPIDPEAEDAPEPGSSAADFIEVIDVHGPFVSWSHALDIDLVNETGHLHQRRRGVSDMRTGARVELSSLVSSEEAKRIVAAGRASLDTMLAVVRDATDERAARARSTLHTFAFDAASFSITDVSRSPAVLFQVSGESDQGEALEMLLPPIRMDEEPAWWKSVKETVPEWSADSLALRWRHAGFSVIGNVDSSRTRLSLAVRADTIGAREWPIAVVPMPAYQFIALGDARIDTQTRAALVNAFDRASGSDPFAARASGRARADGYRFLSANFRTY